MHVLLKKATKACGYSVIKVFDKNGIDIDDVQFIQHLDVLYCANVLKFLMLIRFYRSHKYQP